MMRRNINANACLSGVLLLTPTLACAPARRYFSSSELATLDNRDILRVAPGPWEHDAVPTVYADATEVPDDLISQLLQH